MDSYGITFLAHIMEVTQLVKEMKLTYNTTPSSSAINLRNVYFTIRIAPASLTYRERALTTQYTQNRTKLAYTNGKCCCAVDACDIAQRLQHGGNFDAATITSDGAAYNVTLPLSVARLQISTNHKIGFVVVPKRRSNSVFCFRSHLQIFHPYNVHCT